MYYCMDFVYYYYYYKARPILFIVLKADGETNMGRSIGIIKIIISDSRVGFL